MGIYKSTHGMNFTNALSCALDDEANVNKFRALMVFLIDFDNKARIEWCEKRNFDTSGRNLNYIINELVSMKILNKN